MKILVLVAVCIANCPATIFSEWEEYYLFSSMDKCNLAAMAAKDTWNGSGGSKKVINTRCEATSVDDLQVITTKGTKLRRDIACQIGAVGCR